MRHIFYIKKNTGQKRMELLKCEITKENKGAAL